MEKGRRFFPFLLPDSLKSWISWFFVILNPDLQRLYDLYLTLTWSTDLQLHLDDTFNTVL